MSQLDCVWRQSRLSNTTKFCIYNSCVLSSLLYASESWTLLKADTAKLETFHMTNQRRILDIIWYEFVTNVEVATLSQLPSINKAISRRKQSLFGHVRRMDQAAPVHQDRLAPGGDNQVVRENAGWSRSPRAVSFWCFECCSGSVSVEGATTRRRSSRERERERERASERASERERERELTSLGEMILGWRKVDQNTISANTF